MGLLKKSASGVLGPLSCSRTVVYAPRANGPAALLDLAPPKQLRASERAFLNSLLSFYRTRVLGSCREFDKF